LDDLVDIHAEPEGDDSGLEQGFLEWLGLGGIGVAESEGEDCSEDECSGSDRGGELGGEREKRGKAEGCEEKEDSLCHHFVGYQEGDGNKLTLGMIVANVLTKMAM
jgi:hypothetical protein